MENLGKPEMRVTSLGFKETIKPPSFHKLEKEIEYHTKAEKHLWNTIAMFLNSEENVRAAYAGKESIIMDTENLMTLYVGCFICEEPYEPSMIGKRCKGQPKGTLRYV